MLEFLIDNIFVSFRGTLFQQVVGIPMGTNCAPLLADLFLFYEDEAVSVVYLTSSSGGNINGRNSANLELLIEVLNEDAELGNVIRDSEPLLIEVLKDNRYYLNFYFEFNGGIILDNN
jgi:hypothetical protein